MTQPTTEFLQLAGGTIAYDDTKGNGQPIICLPLMGDMRQVYRHVRPTFVNAGYRVITMDPRGLGESSVNWLDYKVESMGADLLALIEHLGLSNVIVIGESISASTAVWAAAEKPELFNRVVLSGPFIRDMPKPNIIMQLATKVVLSSPRFWIPYYKALYPTRKPADFKDYTQKLLTNLREPNRYAATVAMTHATHAATAARYDKLRAPTLVLMGSKDVDFPDPAKEAKLCAELTRGTSRIIEGGGHVLMAEYPEEFAEAVLTFIAK